MFPTYFIGLVDLTGNFETFYFVKIWSALIKPRHKSK